jgi:hypothetical protein
MKNIYVPITKVQDNPDGTCEIYGTAALEQVDRSKEIIDYATAKPQFEKWRDETLQRSGGKSMGNIRSMHGKIAAGKATAIDFDDVNKTVGIGAHIVDPVEAQKIRLGVLCGYSIGGGYLKRWPDPGNPGVMRYTPELTETSVVDSPCMPGALIQHIKMDGSTELIKAVGSGLEPPPTFSTRRSSKLEKPPVAVKSFGADVCPKCNEPMKDGKCLKCDKAAETGDLSKGVKYLVTEDDGTTHLPYTDESGKPDHAHMGAAHAALHGGYRGNKYEGPKKQEAKDKLKALYASEKLDLLSEKWNGEGEMEKAFDAAQPRDPAAHFASATTDDGSPHHGNVMRGQAAKAKASGDEMGAASLKATAASHDAYVEQTADAHDKAAKAHSDAAQVHRDGGNPVQGVIHDLHAAHHGNEANKLRAAEPVPASGPFAPNAPTADLPAPTMLSAGTPVDATFSARKAAEANLSKDAAGISTGTGLGFYDQDSTPGAEAKVKQCPCGGTLVDGICTACRKEVKKVAPDGLLEKVGITPVQNKVGVYLIDTFPHALAKRRSAPIDQRLQKSLWDTDVLVKSLERLTLLEEHIGREVDALRPELVGFRDAELIRLRKVFLDLAAEEAAGQIAESTNAGNRERFANASQEVVSITSLLKEFFEVAGFSAKQ